MRKDTNPALFVTFGESNRLKAHDLSKQFKHYAEKAGLKKKVTPHILRHTAATTMSHNGADIRNIQLILGHSDIKTTAKYYLGVDKEALRKSHSQFLKYD
jgi:integrase/recombinase XerD